MRRMNWATMITGPLALSLAFLLRIPLTCQQGILVLNSLSIKNSAFQGGMPGLPMQAAQLAPQNQHAQEPTPPQKNQPARSQSREQTPKSAKKSKKPFLTKKEEPEQAANEEQPQNKQNKPSKTPFRRYQPRRAVKQNQKLLTLGPALF